MKIHITNVYNINKESSLSKKQHYFSAAGHSLGFHEMGIFSYPVETDTDQELSKRLDGIIASLEPEDIVFVQLPTMNGYRYEQRLINKCKAYKNTKVVLIIHDSSLFSDESTPEVYNQYLTLRDAADAVIVPTTQNTYTQKKVLLDAIESLFADENKRVLSSLHAMQEEIHIGFGLHDKSGNYSVWVGVAIQSIIEHTNSRLCFHILHDNTLTEQNRQRLSQVASQNSNRIVFHLLDESLFLDSANQMEHYTIGALFRIMLPELIPELDKIIYLDADILVNRDIKELWETDITDYYMAAVADNDVVSGLVKPRVIKNGTVSPQKYFNSGVLYMNLTRIRQKGNMREEVFQYLQQNRASDLPDQDALNAIYTLETLLLDNSWNYFVRPLQQRHETNLGNYIYHFVGTRIILYSFAAIDRLYYETTGRTPWGIEECRTQLQKSLYRTHDRRVQLEKLIHQIAHSNKKHIFYGEETNAIRNMYKFLTIREGDYRVLSEIPEENNPILPCKKLAYLSEEQTEFIIFVLPESDNGNAIINLEKMGYENEKDFFVIPRLLPPNEGGYM